MQRIAALSLSLLLAGAAFGQEAVMANGAAIRAAIAENTVQGSMTESGAYTEFYAADGTIKGKDYAGTWTIDGDAMCFAYGKAPVCATVALAADQVTWFYDGQPSGTGTILPGNPNGF